MKIRRGKIAILLFVVGLVIPALVITAIQVKERAVNYCTRTPTAEPDSLVTVEFSDSPLGWVCHKTFVDISGEPIGETIDTRLPLIP